jgi:hypothetical protein
MSSQKLQRLLDDRTLEAAHASDEEILGFWRKALVFYADSHLPGLSAEGAFYLAYQVALSAATAVVRTAGYRVRSRGQHHFATFYVLQALGDSELAEFAFDLDSYRADRHETVYDFEGEAERTRATWREIQRLFAEFLPHAEAWLLRERPALAHRLQRFTPKSIA